MSVLRPRNRTVFFRLSQEEFRKLTELCADSEGARSVSELSRSAVQKLISRDNSPDGRVQEVLLRLDQTVAEMREKMEQLMQVLDAHKTARPESQQKQDGTDHNRGEG